MTLYSITRLTPEGIHYRRPGKGGGYFAAYPFPCDRIDSFVWREDADGVREALEWNGVTLGEADPETGEVPETMVNGEIVLADVDAAIQTASTATLEQLRDTVFRIAERRSWERRQEGITIGGMHYADIDGTTARLEKTVRGYLPEKPSDHVIYWDGPEGTIRATAAELVALGVALGDYEQATFKRRCELKDAARAAFDAGDRAALEQLIAEAKAFEVQLLRLSDRPWSAGRRLRPSLRGFLWPLSPTRFRGGVTFLKPTLPKISIST